MTQLLIEGQLTRFYCSTGQVPSRKQSINNASTLDSGEHPQINLQRPD